MSIRYIGSKARLANSIVDLAGRPGRGRFVDAFSGTGSVAAAASSRGWTVVVNDALASAVAMSTGALVGHENVPFSALGGYEAACMHLDDLSGHSGFLHHEYSPASESHAGVERRYFTEANAARLDAMRSQIASWSEAGLLTINEERLLLADLIHAANRVANISGTYGCFLSNWTSNALRPIELKPRELPDGSTKFEASMGDVFDVRVDNEDVVYYDPPYTKRQYAAYYHLMETLVAGDQPKVGGITGLRPWRDKASDFSYKSRALATIRRLILSTPARRILLSYSTEGHVDREQLLTTLSEVGSVQLHAVETIGRYRPNAGAAAAGETVDEYVIEIEPFTVNEVVRRAAHQEAVYA